VEGDGGRRALHGSDCGSGGHLPPRRGRGQRLDVHEADHRLVRPRSSREADQDDREAWRNDCRADERFRQRPTRGPSRLRGARPAGAARALNASRTAMRVDELAPGLWSWTTRHREWDPAHAWEPDVRCFYVETGD